MHGEGAGDTCPNCGTARAGSFCQGCGQAAHIHHDLRGLGHDLAHGVLHFEGKFGATFPLLVQRPGELTWRYVQGERAKFVTPMALFLFAVFLLFATVNRLTMPDLGRTEGRQAAAHAAEQNRNSITALEQQRAEILAKQPHASTAAIDAKLKENRRDLTLIEAMFPQVTRAETGQEEASDEKPTGVSWIDHQIKTFNENRALYAYKIKMASYKYSWALIPISVPFIWLLFFWRRDFGLYHHAIFAIHSLSFITLLVVGLIGLHFLRVPAGLLWLVFMLTPPLHLFRHLKGAYRLGRWGALWRTVAMLMFTGMTSSLFVLLLIWLETE
jgi:hypothetical protein